MKIEIVTDRSPITLRQDQLDRISEGHCPDCDHSGFRIGPMAGHQINIVCGGDDRHRFNVCFFGGVAQMGHRN